MRHRSTDPACVHHSPPSGWFSRWRFDRNRGRSCQRCRAGVDAPVLVADAAGNVEQWSTYVKSETTTYG